MPTARQLRDAQQKGPDLPNDLKVKTKCTQRLLKEVKAYVAEVSVNRSKYADMEAKGADQFDLKNFQNVLNESLMMVPDSKARLVKSYEDLELFMDLNCKDEAVMASEFFEQAKELLQKKEMGEGGGKENAGTETADLQEGEVF